MRENHARSESHPPQQCGSEIPQAWVCGFLIHLTTPSTITLVPTPPKTLTLYPKPYFSTRSERLKFSGSSGEMLKETGSINRSLFTLGKVVLSLSADSECGTCFLALALRQNPENVLRCPILARKRSMPHPPRSVLRQDNKFDEYAYWQHILWGVRGAVLALVVRQ